MSRVLAAIKAKAAASPTAPALSNEGRNWSYADLDAEIDRAADALARFAPNARTVAPVAVRLDNGPAWVILDLALVRLGWPSLPIPGFFTADQCAHALSDAGAGLLIAAEPGAPDLTIAGLALSVTPINLPPVSLPPCTAKITYTSGSTGRPKGVCLSQDQMEAVAASIVEVIGADYGGRHLPLLPLAVLLENVAGLYASLLAGGEYHALAQADVGLGDPFKPDLKQLASAIAGSGATSLILVPELLRAILMLMAFTGRRFPNLNLVAVGGAKVAEELLRQADAVGLPVYEGYGLSECASVVALNTPTARKTGAVGRPLPHVDVSISPEGEVVVGPAPFLGYAGGALCGGPWRTGDLGRMDAGGFLFVDGRRDSLIITAFGRNISPEWVESELLAQPQIRQAIVFDDGAHGLAALIVPLVADLDDIAIGAAVDRANLRLPAYAQVARWHGRGPLEPALGEVTGNGRPRRAAVIAIHRLVEAAE